MNFFLTLLDNLPAKTIPVDEIVSNVYEGLLEPTEGSEMIVKINNL